jgi:hypothetical protein
VTKENTMMITTNPNGFTANFGAKEIDVCQGEPDQDIFIRMENASCEAITIRMTSTEFDTFVSYCKGLTLR